jgi:protein SCO1/2
MVSDVVDDDCCSEEPRRASSLVTVGHVSSPLLGGASAIALALFPKCPMCWAAYLSLFGVAGVEWLSHSAWLWPLLVLVMLSNVAALWWLGRRSKRRLGFYLSLAGALTILVLGAWLELPYASAAGIALTALGSLASVGRSLAPWPFAQGSRARSAPAGASASAGPTR